jgi:hypothetical protein
MTHTARLMVTACLALFALAATADPTELRAMAHEYYGWQAEAYPVIASNNGEHRYDSRLTDFHMAAVLEICHRQSPRHSKNAARELGSIVRWESRRPRPDGYRRPALLPRSQFPQSRLEGRRV